MKVAVCDDDVKVSSQILRWVQEYENETCTVNTYASGEELYHALEHPDVIFLDIDMGGMNGIETARQIRKIDKDVKIIYVTSFREYVSGAFSVHAFAYLLKPVTRKAIYQQLDEVRAYRPIVKKRVLVEFNTETGVERILVSDILYFEYLDRRIFIHCSSRVLKMKGRITDVEHQMEVHNFAAPHKSFVVNLYQVKAIKGYDIQMMNGDQIPLSQKKSTEFRRRLNVFLSGYIGEK